MPHTQTSKEFCACAYTSKIFKFCQMMHQRGHAVYHYGVKGSDPPCTENVGVMTRERQKALCDHPYYKVNWDHRTTMWQEFNYACIDEVRKRAGKKDFLCVIAGLAQKPVADALAPLMAVEYGVGYEGTFSNYRCFESYSHIHTVWAKQGTIDGRFYDVVIPNYFDPDDFPQSRRKGDYLLYLGRLIKRKGIEIAVQTARVTGKKLVIAGPGSVSYTTGILTCEDGGVYEGVEYVGLADVTGRARLLSEALAVLVPTLYVEPFGGVAVEAQLAGTPAITTDWGAFPETVEHGKTGFRCRTLGQFRRAVESAAALDRSYIRDRAARLYSLEAVAPLYEAYFAMLTDLWADGWNTLADRPFVAR